MRHRRPKRRIDIKTEITNILDTSKSVRDVESSIRRLQTRHKLGFFTVYTSAIHLLSERDDLTACGYILRRIPDGTRTALVNAPVGRCRYTPLTRAVFRGSLRMIKFLRGCGADLEYVNTHGESMLDALDQGEVVQLKKRPHDAMFTRNRFQECRVYMKKAKESPIIPTTVEELRAGMYVPRRVKLAGIRIKWWWRRQQMRQRAPPPSSLPGTPS